PMSVSRRCRRAAENVLAAGFRAVFMGRSFLSSSFANRTADASVSGVRLCTICNGLAVAAIFVDHSRLATLHRPTTRSVPLLTLQEQPMKQMTLLSLVVALASAGSLMAGEIKSG